MNSLAEREPFDTLPEGVTLDRESRQQLVRAVLMTYCEPKGKYDGMTAWDVAGKILAAMDGGHAN